MLDAAKQRREFLRWVLLLGLNNAHPYGAYEEVVLSIVQGVYADATRQEVRRELEYLHDRELVEVTHQPDGRWKAKINRHGIDLVEYTVECDPGIARPEKVA